MGPTGGIIDSAIMRVCRHVGTGERSVGFGYRNWAATKGLGIVRSAARGGFKREAPEVVEYGV